MTTDYVNNWLDRYKTSDRHIRGCMLEGLAHEMEHGAIHHFELRDILRGIASWMK